MKIVIFPMLMEYCEERNLLHLNPYDIGGNAEISTHQPQKFLQESQTVKQAFCALQTPKAYNRIYATRNS
jgi:hypothetical protein